MVAACSPFRPFSTLGLSLTVISIALLAASIGRPNFMQNNILDVKETLGAFQICAQAPDLDYCANINTDCEVTVNDITKPLDNCTAFNTFRGLMVMGIIVGAVYIILSSVLFFTLRTGIRIWRIISFVLGVAAVGCLGVSIFTVIGYKSDDSPSTAEWDASFPLEITGAALMLVGVIAFFIGSLRESVPPSSAAAVGAGYQQFNDASVNTPYKQAEAAQPGYASYAYPTANTGYP